MSPKNRTLPQSTHRIIARLALAAVAFVAVASSGQDSSLAAATHGIVVPDMDRAIKPGDDFFTYANGSWVSRTQIPPDRPSLGVFSILGDQSNKNTAALIAEAAKAKGPAGSNARKIADVYNSYMDEAGIEARGLAPLRPHLDKIADIHNKRELALALGESLRADVDALNNTNFHTANIFGLWVAPGFEDSDHYAAYLLQGGLQLPNRDYYLSGSERMQGIRAKYQAHIAAMLKLAGLADTDARAARILELEKAIAEKHISLADSEDIAKANNTWTQADFTAKAPGLDWTAFFQGANLSRQPRFTVWQPTAFTGESALVASIPLDTWKDWLSYHLIEAYAGVLPAALADERFSFFGKTLSGVSQQRPRWQRGVGVVNGFLGDAVGQIYAKRYFSPGQSPGRRPGLQSHRSVPHPH